MDARILSIGTELVSGQHLDTNAAWLASELTRLGVRVVAHETVGDDVDRIREAIARGVSVPGICIATGGLGPTGDDLTREATALAVDRPLEENREALDLIEALFRRWRRDMPRSNRVQAGIPRGCRVIPNERGTAPGIHFAGPNADFFALPGVPLEMKPMFRAYVAGRIRQRVGAACTRLGRLRCFGLSEARIGEMLADLMARERNPLVGTAASGAIITLRILVRAATETDAEALIADDVAEIRRRLGPAVFGENDETLETVVADLLEERGLTVATAESCTGGLLAKRLTDVPGSSRFFLRGYVTYSNDAKRELLGVPAGLLEAHGAVSEAVARAMASGCRTSAGVDVALSTTGIAGPGGGRPPDKPVGLVFIGLATGTRIDVKRLVLGDHLPREETRDRACSAMLNLLRLHLLSDSR